MSVESREDLFLEEGPRDDFASELQARGAHTLVEDLRREPVRRYLDPYDFVAVDRGARVVEVIGAMRGRRCGCALVTRDGRLAGIFTERDVLQRVLTAPETWNGPVEAVMTPEPRTLHGDETVGAAIQFMVQGHYRNVPVVDGQGAVIGNLTHYDLLRFLADRFQAEVYNLPPDPDQVPDAVEGA
jgi:CBS domain-containing protein